MKIYYLFLLLCSVSSCNLLAEDGKNFYTNCYKWIYYFETGQHRDEPYKSKKVFNNDERMQFTQIMQLFSDGEKNSTASALIALEEMNSELKQKAKFSGLVIALKNNPELLKEKIYIPQFLAKEKEINTKITFIEFLDRLNIYCIKAQKN